MRSAGFFRSITLAAFLMSIGTAAHAQEASWLRDRGRGQPTSMFGTYIQKGELLVYPFFERYVDRNLEYEPFEFGYGLEQPFRGRYTANEGLLFVAYGLSHRVALEFEAAVINARLEKAPDDPSAQPAILQASGLGDVEGQVRVRWTDETATRPELFSYLELVSPRKRDQPLIGTPTWEYKLGTGWIKGTSLGTFTVRAAVEYTSARGALELGEYALEYVRRVNSRLLLYAGVEGTEGEVEWITEAQVRLAPRVVLKLNNAFGMTSTATDWAPEIGLMISLGRGGRRKRGATCRQEGGRHADNSRSPRGEHPSCGAPLSRLPSPVSRLSSHHRPRLLLPDHPVHLARLQQPVEGRDVDVLDRLHLGAQRRPQLLQISQPVPDSLRQLRVPLHLPQQEAVLPVDPVGVVDDVLPVLRLGRELWVDGLQLLHDRPPHCPDRLGAIGLLGARDEPLHLRLEVAHAVHRVVNLADARDQEVGHRIARHQASLDVTDLGE
jgi:hypothetical protein